MTASSDYRSEASSPPSTLPVEEVEAEKVIPVQETATPPPPPNGGLVAWLQVVGAFFLFFNSWGVVNTFGVYQTYYETDLLHGHSPSSISWIGTVQGFLLFLVGVVAGPFFDKGYLKTMIALGSFLVVFGLMMTSLSSQYYQVFLAHGIAVGIGCAFLFLPSIAIVATYFTTRRAVATGITASGGSIGMSSSSYPTARKHTDASSRLRDIPHHLPQTHRPTRLWLDHPYHRLHRPRRAVRLPRRDAHATAPSQADPIPPRPFCLQRNLLPDLQLRSVLRLRRPLLPFLLPPHLHVHRRPLNRQPSLLHHRHPQRHLRLRPYHPRPGGRPYRLPQHHHPHGSECGDPRVRLDRDQEHCRDDRVRVSVWVCLWGDCLVAADDCGPVESEYEYCRGEDGDVLYVCRVGAVDWESDCRGTVGPGEGGVLEGGAVQRGHGYGGCGFFYLVEDVEVDGWREREVLVPFRFCDGQGLGG